MALNFVNFNINHLKTIDEALIFAKDLVVDYYSNLALGKAPNSQQAILTEMNEVAESIITAIEFFRENFNRKTIPLNETEYSLLMDMVHSSLEVYRKHLEETQRKSEIKDHYRLINTVDEILALDRLKEGKRGIFKNYHLRRDKG